MGNDKIKDVKVPLMVVLGETQISVEELARIGEGSIITLNRNAGEPVDVLAAGELVAKAEVVVIDENFGIRVSDVIKKDG
jgi:flagellar motor switch protein FliN/FliY